MAAQSIRRLPCSQTARISHRASQCAPGRGPRTKAKNLARRRLSPGRSLGVGCEASSNSRKSPVTTKATCSPMSTALSAIRSIARAASSIVIAHSRLSASSPISSARRKHSRLRSSTTSSWRTRSRAISTSRSSKARLACEIRARVCLPIAGSGRPSRSSAGGSLPEIGITLQMFTHWSPIRSTFFSTCSSAAIRRRSVATGDCVASSVIRPGGPRGSGRRCGRRRRRRSGPARCPGARSLPASAPAPR